MDNKEIFKRFYLKISIRVKIFGCNFVFNGLFKVIISDKNINEVFY